MTAPEGGERVVDLPVFMPVGTKGTLKGMTVDQLEELGCQIFLGNTYHLGLRPGSQILREAGGLHRFQSWNRALLTDSGGFQMVSLLKLSKLTEEGVSFQSPHDGSRMLLTPELSMQLQNDIGADIMMQLDDVVNPLTEPNRMREAMDRSIRWLDRCIAAHQRPESQSLFAIIQGGLDESMRLECIAEMVKRNLPGYAIGGLSGGEDKEAFWKTVLTCTKALPDDRPIYCMGVGYAIDLVVCVALGVDMFDCVFPTRTARFGNALTKEGSLNLKNSRFREDFTPLESDCGCFTCKNYTRAFLQTVVATKEATACQLLTIHNVSYQLRLMNQMQSAIEAGEFPVFVRRFLDDLYKKNLQPIPGWVCNAFKAVNLDLTQTPIDAR